MTVPRVAALAVALALVTTACGPAVQPSPSPPAPPSSATPSATPSGTPPASLPSGPSATPLASDDLAAVYREINDQVRQIRGLEEREPVEPRILEPEEMKDVLERIVREDTPPEVLAAYERLYHAMGLLPKDDSLADVYVDLLESQVAGLYDPATDSLYVVSKEGGVGPVEKVFYSHEYVHALQDQNFDLEAFQPADLLDETDRQMARLAVVEGDAYTAMTQWLQANLGPMELLEFLQASQDPEALEALERIPPIVATQILFAATTGFLWVLGIQSQGGWEAVDALFDDPPESTEQILHPEKWASREPPIEVDLPANLATTLGEGWSIGLEDTLGEAQIAVWLTGSAGGGGLPPPPPAAAIGWGGDRLALLDGPDGAWAVVIRTVWDTPSDATEFQGAIGEVVDAGPNPGTVIIDGRDVTIVLAIDGTTLNEAVSAAGFVIPG